VRVALKALNGLDSVDVSLERGTATTKWKPGNTVTLREMLAAVEKNGFANKGAKVVVAGQVSESGGKWRLAVSGTGENYELVAANATLVSGLKPGERVVVSGSVPEPVKGSAPTVINVEKVEVAD
jgi:copper chaperone CopZ